MKRPVQHRRTFNVALLYYIQNHHTIAGKAADLFVCVFNWPCRKSPGETLSSSCQQLGSDPTTEHAQLTLPSPGMSCRQNTHTETGAAYFLAADLNSLCNNDNMCKVWGQLRIQFDDILNVMFSPSWLIWGGFYFLVEERSCELQQECR